MFKLKFAFGLKDFKKPLTLKKYKDGSDCLILFPDGSGSVFYPSGRLALSVISISPGMHIVSGFSDEPIHANQILSFDPYGNGCCNFNTGKIRQIIKILIFLNDFNASNIN